jgi:hypothetical protein
MKNQTHSINYNNNRNKNTLTKQTSNQSSSRSIPISNQKQKIGSVNSLKISHDSRIPSGSSDVFN